MPPSGGDEAPQPPAPWGPPRANAIYFDGSSNRRRAVHVHAGDALEIAEDGRPAASWAYAQVRRHDAPDDVLRIGSLGAPPLARLEIRDPALQGEVIARAPALDRSTEKPATMRIVGWSLAAVASIVLVAAFGVPLLAERLAPLVPPSFEKRVGGAADQQVRAMFGDRACNAGEGSAAFTKMVEAVRRAGGVEAELQTQVLASAVPNAFALPGGTVYLLSGLLTRAETPDEVAGVIAHEIGHVIHRDHVRRMIQTGGTSFLIGLLFGDVTGATAVIFATRTLIDSAYSRDAENAADAFAISVMHKLGRSPKPMGELLVRLTSAGGKGSIFSSHPMSADRLALMTREDRPVTGPEILSPSEWLALKTICGRSGLGR